MENTNNDEDAKSDRSENAFGLVELLTDTNYQEIIFEHKDFKQKIYALKSASTDYDLTGQVIWQAADIMSIWFVEEFLQNFQDKSVLELGSGPGLCGLIAAHTAKQVVLTDYQDLVMDLIDKNISFCNPRPNECKLFASQLDWERMEENNFYENLDYTNANQCIEGKLKNLNFDIVIGSDVIYWPKSIKPLCRVLNKLFSQNKNMIVYICYVERIKAVHKSLLEEFQICYFLVEEVGQSVTKNITNDAYIYKIQMSS